MKDTYSKYLSILIAIMALMSGSITAHAATGWCTSASPYTFNFNFAYNLTDPSQNYAGKTISNAYEWVQSGNYTATCDATQSYSTSYFKGDAPGTSVYTNGSLTYYAVNDYLAAATEIKLASGGCVSTVYAPVPFTDMANGCSYTPAASTSYTSGGKGRISLYFRRPFVGQVTIPSTVIARLYASLVKGSYAAQPISQVLMGGTVTVPQSCNINAGQVITVDFGNIAAPNIQTKGAIANGFTPKRVNVTLACSNISEGVNISLSINGQSSSGDTTALKTSNNDIGVRIKDATGNVVSPNSGRLPVTMNYAAQTGTSSMSLAPMNVTGRAPLGGAFNAVATINAEMQ